MFTVGVFAVAGVMDFVYREVDPELWIIPAPIGVALGITNVLKYYEGPLWLPYLVNGLIAVVFLVMYWLEFMGGADLAAVLFVAVSLPIVDNAIMPSVLLMLLYSAPFVLGFYVFELTRRCGLNCLLRLKVRVKGKELVSKYRWWHPSGVRIEGDPHEVVAKMNAWDKTIEASPLLPLVTLMFLGLIMAIIIGDGPIIALLGG
ncbi:MAG: hypothetical protein F7C37_00420 [Desulfurococcales archaeon]|nr:hypothetical protein [Desulfurococcales archaeon]MCE4623022.1 hypothetical protein [Desulfurococcales archaeon]